MTHQPPEGSRVIIFATVGHNARDWESANRITTNGLHAFGYHAVHVRVTDAETARAIRAQIDGPKPVLTDAEQGLYEFHREEARLRRERDEMGRLQHEANLVLQATEHVHKHGPVALVDCTETLCAGARRVAIKAKEALGR
jgi:hypothetical protein